MNSTSLLNQYKPMLYQAVWKYKHRYPNVEFSEIKSMAYELFSKILNKYDPNKASFSTYLYHSLKALNKYCKDESVKDNDIELIPELENKREEAMYDNFIKTMEIIDSKTSLSTDAQEIIQFITGRTWEVPGCNYIRPSWHSIRRWYKYCGWPDKRIRNAWTEIGKWWKGVV